VAWNPARPKVAALESRAEGARADEDGRDLRPHRRPRPAEPPCRVFRYSLPPSAKSMGANSLYNKLKKEWLPRV